MSSMLTCYTIYCLGDLGFTLIRSFLPLRISASSMWMIIQWYEQCLLKSNHSRVLKTTLLMLFSTGANKVAKEPLLEDDNSSNEVDSEPEEDTQATFTFKPIVAYLKDPECYNPTEDDGEWVINENITFDYPVSVDLFKSTDDTSLHMPLSMLSMISTSIKNGKGSVFVVPQSNKIQSPIVFCRVQL